MEKKIKIIDLLNKIANDEKIPEVISIRGNEFKIWACSSIESFYRDYDGTNWLECIDIKLTDEVEILDEEDEFEDIEEIIYPDLNEDFEYELHHKHIEEIYDTINALIKNQKKIIERLKDE